MTSIEVESIKYFGEPGARGARPEPPGELKPKPAPLHRIRYGDTDLPGSLKLRLVPVRGIFWLGTQAMLCLGALVTVESPKDNTITPNEPAQQSQFYAEGFPSVVAISLNLVAAPDHQPRIVQPAVPRSHLLFR